MRISSSMAVVFGWLWLLLGNSLAQAETITDPQLGITLKLSSEFKPRPDLVGLTPDIIHAFQYGEAAEGEELTLFFVERLGGTIGREHIKPEHMPPGFKGSLFLMSWKGFEVDGFDVPEVVDGVETTTLNVQVPIKGRAIQLKMFGVASRKDQLRTLLQTVLDGLDGQSNWLASAAPGSMATSSSYSTVLLVIAIVGILCGLVLLWFIARRTPKGTVLAIAIVLYIGSWAIGTSSVRELVLLSGATRMLGVAAGILGIVDLCRKRP